MVAKDIQSILRKKATVGKHFAVS